MSAPKIGKAAPKFTAEATSEQTITLNDLKGQNVILYFYPKDSTPGCTTEGQNFRDSIKKFEKLNTVIFGVSRDSIKSHEKFKEKQCFPFELLSDPEEELCNKFDVIKEKNMYGKKYMGIERSTFLIDDKGVLRQEWRKVKVPGHVDEILEAVKAL
ncbi:MAG: thioredoxin-dependent thiol peroxidase [Thiotrichales bacterium]|nr:thioredoxin-dependent thiol peroxidase [Thiotrichales bacterium]